MNYLEAIVEIKNVIENDFNNRIISLIKKRATKNLLIGEDKLNTETRNVKGYQLDFTSPTNLFYWNYVKQEITRLYSFYKAKFPMMKSNKINQIDLLKYLSYLISLIEDSELMLIFFQKNAFSQSNNLKNNTSSNTFHQISH